MASGAILECLTWWPPQPPKTASASMRRSVSSSSAFWGADDAEVSESDRKAIKELQRLRALRTPQQELFERFKQKNEADNIKGLLRKTGKVQHQALTKPRRVRKDFRDTNLVSDIDGASSRKLCGHSSSGIFVDEHSKRDWRYSGASFARETQEAADALFEQPPPPPPPPPMIPLEEHPEYRATVAKLTKQGFSAAERHRILKKAKQSGEFDHILKPSVSSKSVGKMDFEERVWRMGAVETHLSTPGIDLRVMPRALEPLIRAPPKPLPANGIAIPPTVPFNSIHNQPQLRGFNGSHLSLGPHIERPRNPKNVKCIYEGKKAPPQWPKPALDTPAALQFEGRPLDKSLSTNDILGAKPRRHWSDESRAELWRIHARAAHGSFGGL